MSTASTGRGLPTKVCPNCGTRVHINAAVCAFCEHDFSVAQPATPVVIIHPKRPSPQSPAEGGVPAQQTVTKPCPTCGASVAAGAQSCPACDYKWRTEAAVADNVSNALAKQKRGIGRPWILGGVATILLVSVCAYLFMPRLAPNPAPDAGSEIARTQLPTTAPVSTSTSVATEISSQSPSLSPVAPSALPTDTAVATIVATATIAPSASPTVQLTAPPLQGRVIGTGPIVTMRSDPATTGTVVLQIPLGQTVDVKCRKTGTIPANFPSDSTDKWYKVSFDGQQGYIYSRLLNVTGTVPLCG